MNFFEDLTQRNADFAATKFSNGLKIIPYNKTLILGCVDPRVDPMDILQLQAGEAAIIRNVGGRVTPGLLEIMDILRTVSKVGGSPIGVGWNFIVLHHTKCGIKGCLQHAPSLLARHMGVPEAGLEALKIDDPYESVVVDVEALRANTDFADDLVVTGMVYDVDTGLISTVVPPAPIRS